jgi:hypothetical protein
VLCRSEDVFQRDKSFISKHSKNIFGSGGPADLLKSVRGRQFRQWATAQLKEYLVKRVRDGQ